MIPNTVVDFEMQDGEVVKMTLTYARLYALRGKDEKTYKAYNRIMTKGIQEEIENVHILYTAYLCANLDKVCMGRDEFLERMPVDREYVNETLTKLLYPKKKKDSPKHLRKRPDN